MRMHMCVSTQGKGKEKRRKEFNFDSYKNQLLRENEFEFCTVVQALFLGPGSALLYKYFIFNVINGPQKQNCCTLPVH